MLPVDLRRQDLQHAQSRDVVQDRRPCWASCCSWRSSFPAAADLERDRHRLLSSSAPCRCKRGEDMNGNGVLDPGEDWDSDGHLDVVERAASAHDRHRRRRQARRLGRRRRRRQARQVRGRRRRRHSRRRQYREHLRGAGRRAGRFPTIDFSTIALLAAFAAIAGCGGLSNAPISNYTRDQGWGMGHHVGAIPSVIGGHNIELSHVGMVFQVTSDSLVALAALAAARAARSAGGVDAGLLPGHGAAQHARRCSSCGAAPR